MRRIAVIAIGGNSLVKDEAHKTVPDQYEAVAETTRHIAAIVEAGYEVVITHGNGPQVGFILLRSELARHVLHPVPLDYCDADTQGAIGYAIQQALGNEFIERKISKQVVTVITQVLVDGSDKAFLNPSKPIGSFYKEQEAIKHMTEDGWAMVEDAGRGYRRVVPSPAPLQIVEQDVIKLLAESGAVVVGVGGGGIPVVRTEADGLRGVEAVIDKDLASSLLARRIGAELFIISTAVEKVCLNFGTPDQRYLDRLTVPEARKFMAEGHFKPGSMLPKIIAAIDFLESGGQKVIITMPEKLEEALNGTAGTHIVLN